MNNKDKTLVVGASGKVGKLLIPILAQQKNPVVAMIRNPDKAKYFEDYNVETRLADLEGDFESAVVDCNKVVFSAGSGAATGADKTLLIDLWGACKLIDAAKKHGVKHFVMVSSRGADNPDQCPLPIRPYMVAKHFADKHLVHSGLNYTILRPGTLLDEPGTNCITTRRPDELKDQVISREDTAKAIALALATEAQNTIVELFKGDMEIDKLFL